MPEFGRISVAASRWSSGARGRFHRDRRHRRLRRPVSACRAEAGHQFRRVNGHLHLRLFVHAEHRRLLRRVQI